MNPLPFFPPPSRALSRFNDKPPPGSGLTKSNSHHGGNRPFSPLSKAKDQSSKGNNGSAGGHEGQSSSDDNTTQAQAQAPPAATNSGVDRSNSRKGTPLATPTADGSRTPLLGESVDLSNLRSDIKRRPTSSGTSTPVTTTGGRLGQRLPPGLFFDQIRPGEVSAAYRMEVKGYPQEDAASLDTLKYRQREAPHLFLGAFIHAPPPKVSGPLTMAGMAQRKLIAFACGTAATALTARSMKVHSDEEDTWLVCLHSVCVAPEYQRRGLALKLVEEYMKRLRKAEQGKGGTVQPKKGYECVALLVHEELIPLYEKAGFKMLGVSHVNWGTGGWFEMRRYIDPKESNDKGSPSSSIIKPAPSSSSLDQLVAATSPSGKDAPLPNLDTSTDTQVDANPSYVLEEKALRMSPDTEEPPLLEISQASAAEETDKAEPAKEEGEQPDVSPFTTAQVLEALNKQQQQNKKRSESESRNPGMAYATIMGQTLAAKTTVEDAFYALEARLVDRETNMNLAEIYCPREECACLLLRVKEADWEIAELGPLASANLSLPNSPTPPTAPVPPPPSSLDRIRSALGSTRSGSATTPVRAFWCVYSPMAFENVGFSKDDDWVPPVLSPKMAAADTQDKHRGGPERKKPTKRASLFRGAADWLKEGRDRERQPTMDTERHREASLLSQGSSSTMVSVTSSAAGAGASAPSEPVKVKYLLCADCDCGPLGYTVLPASLQGGKFAQEVGKTLENQDSSKTEEQPKGQEQQEPPVYLIAADRVRYRFVKG